MSWIGLKGFVARYDISKHTAYKLVQKELVPFGRIGRKLVFNVEECDAWIRQRGSSGRLDFPVSEEKAQEQQVAQISDDILASA